MVPLLNALVFLLQDVVIVDGIVLAKRFAHLHLIDGVLQLPDSFLVGIAICIMLYLSAIRWLSTAWGGVKG